MHTNNGFMPLRVHYITAQGDLYFSLTGKALATVLAHFLQISWEHA
jgi:hypothetical protein